MMDFKNKVIIVVGLGESGLAAARLLKRQGAKARVTEISAKGSVACLAKMLQKEGIEVQLGVHTEDFIKGADLVVTSPGVSDKAMPLIWARQHNIKVIDEIELGYIFCKAPIIAVTGTNGKSTTASLIGHVLEKSGYETFVCGNIGNAFCGQIERLTEDSVVVLEVSSFQLSRIGGFRPNVAVFLNVTRNHLDRHSDFDEYFGAKMRIFQNQKKGDWAVLNYEDKNIKKKLGKIRAKKIFFAPEGGFPARAGFASVKDGRLFIRLEENSFDICAASDLKIKGRHNIENALAAISALSAFGLLPEAIARAIKTFCGLEHRCEDVAVVNGVRFINDSKSTTVDATIKALDLCQNRVVLIAGGRDKNSDFEQMSGYLPGKVKAAVLIGEARDKIKNIFARYTDIKEADSMQDAVRLSFDLAGPGNTVLLSPMCASFDMFQDYKHRGRVFKESVLGLKSQTLCAGQG